MATRLRQQTRTNGRETWINPKLLIVLRERSGLSVRELARRSGLAPSTISRIERGHRIPEPATVKAIARGLRVASLDLLR